MEKLENNLNKLSEWIRPDLENERGEIERMVKDFLGRQPNDELVNKIIEIVNNSPIVELGDNDWAALENTDSFYNVDPGQVDQAREICEEYNQSLDDRNKRNFDKLLNGFNGGSQMESPVIIKNSEGRLHLLSGNTRLMIARALRLRPQVVISEIK